MTKRQAAYSLFIIFTANFLSYLDRQIVGALETELRGAHGLSQKEFGIVGSAFTVGYMVFAPIVGYLTARYHRPRIFAACVFLWSLATIGSGFAPTKHLLYATRFFIGIGEAGCLVIGPTLISDYYAKEVRGRALSIFFLGLPLGGTAGYIVGGLLTKALGWQYAFFFAGLPGFLVAVLIWLLTDPPRGGLETTGPAAPPPPAAGMTAPASSRGGRLMREIRPYFDLLRNRTLFLIILAQAFAVMFLQPLLLFGVGFFEQERAYTKEQATVSLGVIALVAGGLGNLLSGVIGDRLARRTRGAYALLAAVAFWAGLPCLLVGFTVHSRWVALPALGLGAFFYFVCMPAVNTQIANAVTAHQRAMAFALAVFILHLLGDTAAPPVFGAVADTIGTKQQAFLIFSFSLLLAGVSCILAARTAARDESRSAAPPPVTSRNGAPGPPP